MRTLVIAAVLSSCAGTAWAQTPGISDGVVPLAPGVTVSVIREASLVPDSSYCSGTAAPLECRTRYETVQWIGLSPGLAVGVDAAGWAYQTSTAFQLDFSEGQGTLLQRIGPDGATQDLARIYRYRFFAPFTTVGWYSFLTPFYFDATNGRIIIAMSESMRTTSPDQEFDFHVALIQISGLPKLFDTLLTFAPGGQLSAVVPAHPDGFRSADSIQVWTGDVRSMPDWSQAQPLMCSEATNPVPGQVVTVADTLPDPAAGHGRYYITASQHGGDRRLGRQYFGGAFSAREPAVLPICAP